MMTERIQQLRKQSLNAVNTLSAERSLLVTEYYTKADSNLPIPILRARTF